MKHYIGISGKDSCATAIVQKLLEPQHTYEYFYNDTGCDLPELEEWLQKVETFLEAPIVRIQGDLKGILAKSTKAGKTFLPSQRARYCTREAKILPMRDYCKSMGAGYVYLGLRADEADRKGLNPFEGLTPKYPLIDLGLDLRAVYSLVSAKGLKPPAFRWQRLKEAVDRELWLYPDWESRLEPWEVDVLLAGRKRPNCYFCFNQSTYEFLWLLETHPDLYWDSASYEKDTYTWVKNLNLAEFAKDTAKQEKVFKLRVNKVSKLILNRLTKSQMEVEDNELAYTSCGLLCGK